MAQPKSENTTATVPMVLRKGREAILGQRGATVWFTGLSASGRSTVAPCLNKRLIGMRHYCCVLDYIEIRQWSGNNDNSQDCMQPVWSVRLRHRGGAAPRQHLLPGSGHRDDPAGCSPDLPWLRRRQRQPARRHRSVRPGDGFAIRALDSMPYQSGLR